MKFKNQKMKRLFAVVITVALVLTLIPSVVFAGVNEEESLNTYNPIENTEQDGATRESSELMPADSPEQNKEVKPQEALAVNEDTPQAMNQSDFEVSPMAGEVAQIERDGIAINYNTLEAAFEDVQSDETIKMLTDYTYATPIEFNKAGSFSLDLNGNTVSYTGDPQPAITLGNSQRERKRPL